MDNVFSQPALELPEVPADFEAKAGSSKTDLVKAIFTLLKSATISGINQSSPQPYDLAALEKQVTELQDQATKTPIIRSVLKAGVTNGNITAAFEDVGTTNYLVSVEPVVPDGDINTVTWAVIDNSKKTNEVTIRIDGTGATYQFLVSIITRPE